MTAAASPSVRTRPGHCAWLRRFSGDAGFSLVEELVALGLVALGLVLLVMMLTTGAVGAATFTDRVTAENLARSQLELIKAADYEPDPLTNPYPTVSAPPPYTLQIDLAFWDSGGATFVAGPTGDGMQKIAVTVNENGDALLTLEDLKVDR